MVTLLIITGPSGSGKTTLIEKLVGVFCEKDYKVGVIKHDPHDHFDIDNPGKDTWKYSQAGAKVTCLASPSRVAIIKKVNFDQKLHNLLEYFREVDLVLAEGYKYIKTEFPVIEVLKEGHEICAVEPLALVGYNNKKSVTPCFKRDDITGISNFIENKILRNKEE